MSNEKNNYKMPPAEGERRAIRGYYNQYYVSSYLIIESLKNNNLEWIKIADPEAGKVDDFQICTGHKVDGYQIKWSKYEKYITFNQVKNLIKDLANGWKDLKKLYPNYKIKVHLVTNDVPSITKNLNKSGEKSHFADFMSQAWDYYKKNGKINQKWEFEWNEFKKSSGLNSTEFEYFVLDCELDLKYNISSLSGIVEDTIFKNDLEHINHKLFKSVASPENIVKISYKELISILGWKDRFEYRYSHNFPVNKETYQTVNSNINNLTKSLNSLKGGYIGVFGTPGSGKSTFLTEFLNSLDERVIYYYTYVPESKDISTKRGETENFLHDLIISLKNKGFDEEYFIVNSNIAQLSKSLDIQLNKLGDDWEKNNHKTIILIDGLDHIEREQTPTSSLLEYLPNADRIPDGVYFVLGSQTKHILPQNIKTALKEEHREIEMKNFTKKEVSSFIEKFDLKITNKQKERIFDLSEGHPLFLAYLMNQVENIDNEKEINNILETMPKYEGNIEKFYESYWSQIEENFELKNFIGLICRLRKHIDIKWMNKWADKKALLQFIKNFSQYFNKENKKWYFFHNSFRLFLQEKTIELTEGINDELEDKRFHQIIAEECGKEKNGFWKWEELYHLLKAENYDKILKLPFQNYFREQYFNFRPIHDIKTDIKLVLEIIARKNSPNSMTQLFLSGGELEERNHVIENNLFIFLLNLIEIGEIDKVLYYIYQGNNLKIDKSVALKLVPHILKTGYINESKKIFSLCELSEFLNPLELKYIHFHEEEYELLSSWATTAIHFKKTDKVIETIGKCFANFKSSILDRGLNESQQKFELSNLKKYYYNIIYNISSRLIKEDKYEDFKCSSNKLISNNKELDYYIDITLEYIWQVWNDNDKECSKSHLTILLKKVKNSKISYSNRISLSEAIFFITGDKNKAKQMIETISLKTIIKSELDTNFNLDSTIYIFRITRLLVLLECKKEYDALINKINGVENEYLKEYYLYLSKIGEISARNYMNNPLNIDEINNYFEKIIKYYNDSNYIYLKEHISGLYFIKETLPDLIKLFIDVLLNYNAEKTLNVKKILEQEWNNDNLQYWSNDSIRKICSSFIKFNTNNEWILNQMKLIDNRTTNNLNIYNKNSNLVNQAKMYIKLNKYGESLKILRDTLNTSFGVYNEKDYQLDSWINWLNKYVETNSHDVENIIIELANKITSLESVDDVKIIYSASEKLLETAFKWNTSNALTLSKFLTKNCSIEYSEILRIFIIGSLKNEKSHLLTIFLITTHLFLPLSTSHTYEIFNKLFERIKIEFNEKKSHEMIYYALNKINTIVEETNRNKIRSELFNALYSQDIFPSNLVDEINENHFTSLGFLELNDSTKLSYLDVKKRVVSINELFYLINNEKIDSHFNWTHLIRMFINSMDKNELNKFNDLFHEKYFENRSYKGFILSKIAEKMYQFDESKAWDIGLELLNFSNKYGLSWHDLSSDIFLALKTLNSIDSIRAKEIIYNVMINYPSMISIAKNMDIFLPLLTTEINVESNWNAIHNHLNFLLENVEIHNNGNIKFKNVHKNINETIAYLLVNNLNCPVNFILENSSFICAYVIINSNNIELENCMKKFLIEDRKIQEEICLILQVLNDKKPEKLKLFSDEISELQKTHNFLISWLVSELCLSLKCSPVKNEVIIMDDIYFKNIPKRNILDEYNGLLNKPTNFSDPVSIRTPLHLNIHFLSLMSGIPEINLCYKAVQIMKKIEKYDKWNETGGKKLRTMLEYANLQYTYTFLHYKIARLSFFYIVFELLSNNMISPFDPTLSYFLDYRDPGLLLIEPSKKPNFITGPEFKKNDSTINLKLVDVKIKEFDSLCYKNIEKNIIGEYTKFKYIDRANLIEEKKSNICLNPSKTSDEIFHEELFVLLKEYLDINTTIENPPIIIKNKYPSSDSLKYNWIALNPIVGYQLGWELSSEGLFRWTDKKGDVMVETIFWTDGLINQFKPLFKHVGEGCIVIATDDAIKKIKDLYGPIKKKMSIIRFSYNNLKDIKYKSKIIDL